MGLETTSYLTGLTPSWPLPTDRKSVGDDHIRLLKATLQNTFPNASKAFRFPKAEIINTSRTIVSSDQNNTIFLDTTASNLVANLPTGLVSTDDGWWCDVVKISGDANGIIVSPGSGSIISRVGGTASIRVGIICEPVRFFWTGAIWICYKPGPMIGSTENFNGASLPPGYLLEDGSVYSNTLFPELFAITGSTVLRDKRGRAEIGEDAAGVNMSAANFGTTPSLGATKIGSSFTLLTANLPAYTPAGGITNGAISISGGVNGAIATSTAVAAAGHSFADVGPAISPSQAASTFAGTAQGGTSTPVSLVQPSIVVKKIIRAC